MINVKNLHAFYGAIEALKGVDVTIADGAITCLIGSNGAGKTTMLKSISGKCSCAGQILLDDGTDLLKIGSRKIAQKRIIHVPEGRRIFPGLTVEENLEAGTVNWRGLKWKADFQKELEDVYNLFPRLKERRKQLGWSLSGGEQQMLAIGRGMMARPNVLMLDEPSMGLAPLVVAELFEKIVEINKRSGITILLVEQNARIALKASDYAYVLERGRISMSGKAGDLRFNPKIIESYLGALNAARRNEGMKEGIKTYESSRFVWAE